MSCLSWRFCRVILFIRGMFGMCVLIGCVMVMVRLFVNMLCILEWL